MDLDTVVAAAINLADEQGLIAVTVRRVAERLGLARLLDGLAPLMEQPPATH